MSRKSLSGGSNGSEAGGGAIPCRAWSGDSPLAGRAGRSGFTFIELLATLALLSLSLIPLLDFLGEGIRLSREAMLYDIAVDIAVRASAEDTLRADAVGGGTPPEWETWHSADGKLTMRIRRRMEWIDGEAWCRIGVYPETGDTPLYDVVGRFEGME